MLKEKVRYICNKCHSDKVRRDFEAVWDLEKQKWRVFGFFEMCIKCGSTVLEKVEA